MRTILLFITLAMCSYSRSFDADCHTTIIVMDCTGGVSGAKVDIELCNGIKPFSLTTDENGKAETTICQDKICNMMITANVPTTKALRDWRSNCKGNNANYICTFNLCK